MVLDDRIETIVEAIVEGRAMWASVRDALAILVGGNLGEVGFVLASTAIAGASPLGRDSLLLVNLLTDMLPAMTIALRPPPRRSPEELLREGPDASLGGALGAPDHPSCRDDCGRRYRGVAVGTGERNL